MKYKNVNDRLEELARNYLEIPSFYTSELSEKHEVSGQQLEKALKAAYLIGEKNGYSNGFGDAKYACNCSLDHFI